MVELCGADAPNNNFDLADGPNNLFDIARPLWYELTGYYTSTSAAQVHNRQLHILVCIHVKGTCTHIMLLCTQTPPLTRTAITC